MKLKLKLMAAAVALVAASGAAQAAIATSTSGNGSLVLFAYDTSAHTTAMFDLGVEMDSFLPSAMSAGGSITWNLGTSSVAGTGAYTGFSSTLNYGSTFADFASASSVKWGVFALDSTGTALGQDRVLSTSNTALATIKTQTKANLTNFGPSQVDTFLAGHNLSVGQSSVANGASLSSDPGVNAAANHSNGFGNSDKFRDKATFVATAFAGTAQSFYMLDTNTGTLASTALVTQFGNAAGNATFLYNDTAGTLTFNQVAAIPEPSEYALMLAGLGMLGFMARRRLNNRA